MEQNEFEELKEQIRSNIPIEEVIGEYMQLNPKQIGLCPFHEESTPSFSVNVKEQYFHCFGCGVGGDIFRFIELKEKKSFGEVMRLLADKAGITLPQNINHDPQQEQESRLIESILNQTAQFYHDSLTLEAKEYLTQQRGFTDDIISKFKIGFAKEGLKEHLIDKNGFLPEFCIKAGVLTNGTDGQLRDFFYQRIIFPTLIRGTVVHLSGRSLGEQKPKYLHLPGEIKHLYNESALFESEVIITEGVPDCLTLVQNGFHAVGVLGAGGFKPEYEDKFYRCQKVYIGFDPDKAGINGAIKTAEIIGENAYLVQIPPGIDINDYFKNHIIEDFKELLKTALNLIEYKISQIPKDIKKTDLPQALNPILQMLAEVEPVEAEAYLTSTIKSRFNLKTKDIDGYRNVIKKIHRTNQELSSESDLKDSKPIYTANLPNLVEIAEYQNQPVFLIKENEKIVIYKQFETNGFIYLPPPKEQLPWLLPRAEEVIKYYEIENALPHLTTDGALYDDLIAYHKSVSELPEEDFYDLLAAWDMHTYLLEHVQHSPIICLFAVPERGKSRTGKSIIYVAYRGIQVESLRDAYIVRVAHNFGASIFFDVMDIWRKAEKNQSEDILLHRFEKGARVPRVNNPELGAFKDTVYYKVFGPTIIGTNEGLHRILETRALCINMPESTAKFENPVTPEYALPLKERLLAFKARHLTTEMPTVLKPAAGRLGDILKPLLQIIRLVKPEREPDFIRLVRILESKRLIENSESLEALILRTLLSISGKVINCTLSVKSITDELNREKPERQKLSFQRVGRRLDAMGFEKGRGHDGGSVILWNDETIVKLKERYGLNKTSETSETLLTESDLEDISDDTDVSTNEGAYVKES